MLRGARRLAALTTALLTFGAAPAVAIPGDDEAGGTTCLPPLCQPSSPPHGLEAVATSAGSISLEWRTSDGWTRNELERRSYGAASWTVVADLPSPDLGGLMEHVDAGLNPDGPYCYRSVAVNDLTGERSLPSLQECAVATASPPAAPTGLTATASSHTAIALAWHDAAHNEHSTRLERRTSGGAWAFVARYGISGTGPMTQADTGLEPATTYCYRLRASNLHGDGTSPEACATTAPAPPPILSPYFDGTLGTVPPEYSLPASPPATNPTPTTYSPPLHTDSGSTEIYEGTINPPMVPAGAKVAGIKLLGLGSGVELTGGRLTHVGYPQADTVLEPNVTNHVFDGQPMQGTWRLRPTGIGLTPTNVSLRFDWN
jgi:hypothetical protein